MKKLLKYIGRKLKYATIRRAIKFKVRQRQRAMQRLNERESIVARIVKAALADSRNILMVAPISGTKYIKMPDEEMFIIIGDSNVVISNHKFYYDIDTSTAFSDYLANRFNRVLERQRNSMEREMLSNVQSGLTDIVNQIDKKIQNHESRVREQL